MARAFRTFLILVFSAAALAVPPGVSAQALVEFGKSELTIVTATARHHFNIELAENDHQRAQGLMFRSKLAPDAGMLFDYETPRRVTMWMKNTLIPLDMLFIGADGRIAHIAERTIPHSLNLVSSHGRVLAVIEVNAGTVARLGIKPGDKVLHKIFGNAE